MTREEAGRIIEGLRGWQAPDIEETEYGDIYITATDPLTLKRVTYDATTGYFC